MPRLPARVAEMADDMLMELFTELTRWADHIGGVVTMHEIDERYAESYYELVWAQVLAHVSPRTRGEGSVTVAKAEATQDPKVREAVDRRDLIYAKRKWLQQMRDNLERDTSLISRELTRRLGRTSAENRVGTFRP